jgi:ribonuclease R
VSRPPRRRKPSAPATPRSPAKSDRLPAGLPSPEVLEDFIRKAGETDVSAIAAHFGLKGKDRAALRHVLKSMQGEGGLAKRGRKGVAQRGALPPVGVADVVERDADGELYVKLAKADDAEPVRLAPDKDEARIGAPGLGDRVLVRFERLESGEVEARMIRRLGEAAPRVLGVVRKARREVRIEPVDRKAKDSFIVPEAEGAPLRDGDLVVAQAMESGRRYGPKTAKVLEIIGREDHPRAASLIAMHTHGIKTGFSDQAEAEANAAKKPTLAGREDLRDLPLITIDPQDARDHDDAVYAQPDGDPKNPEGWIVWVAIADVAAYVRQGSALDREAWTKGNSVYFPDRVEPMLPEVLSAGLCSLRENEERATLAVRMVFDQTGKKLSHRFVRGLMRSAAKLSYQQAQAAIDGAPDDKTGPLLDRSLRPLWAAYACLGRGRSARSPLEITSGERSIVLNEEGEVASIRSREQLEAHKLIEEMMIQANVAAAEELEKKRSPLIYRIHDTPSQEKLFNLADFLGTIAIPWTKGEPVGTARFNRLLDQTRSGPHAEIVNEVVLRTQMQAVYSTDNIGHFGLNLQKYAHFTSPIRRYADLIVHRALIRALKLGDDGLKDVEVARLNETAEHITATERAAMAAERDATDRYVAAFLADRVGAEFTGRITGVTRFGVFIRLSDTGADGLIPVSTLGGEFFVHDERQHALVGERSGSRWRLGRTVDVRLKEATPLTGGLLFEMISEPEAADPDAPRPRLGVRNLGGRGPGSGPGGKSGGRPPPRGGLKGVRLGKRR